MDMKSRGNWPPNIEMMNPGVLFLGSCQYPMEYMTLPASQTQPQEAAARGILSPAINMPERKKGRFSRVFCGYLVLLRTTLKRQHLRSYITA